MEYFLGLDIFETVDGIELLFYFVEDVVFDCDSGERQDLMRVLEFSQQFL